ncbi:SDR family NAD(P)-dependent oxidoreductase [Arcticibacter sp. MXS-1]|uniref:SDR family NAD(P)-dependent oxidoreductase n=1 Tax=Arcticibacter sp. MXS-1 TaxID=3341726 RepID=UPI0035A87B06
MKKNNYQGALQRPLGSGFNAASTASEVIKGIDLRGKIAVVTGGNTGIGLETTKILAGAGATVIVPARDIEKAKRNLEGVPGVELERMDLVDLESVDAFAARFLESGRPLHLLINNAGIMWVPLQRDARGIESQLATNYLAQFQLVARLWPALKKPGEQGLSTYPHTGTRWLLSISKIRILSTGSMRHYWLTDSLRPHAIYSRWNWIV